MSNPRKLDILFKPEQSARVFYYSTSSHITNSILISFTLCIMSQRLGASLIHTLALAKNHTIMTHGEIQNSITQIRYQHNNIYNGLYAIVIFYFYTFGAGELFGHPVPRYINIPFLVGTFGLIIFSELVCWVRILIWKVGTRKRINKHI